MVPPLLSGGLEWENVLVLAGTSIAAYVIAHATFTRRDLAS
jgi:ABC-type transport system involved in multi-copper enzyme maturation permease subunit